MKIRTVVLLLVVFGAGCAPQHPRASEPSTPSSGTAPPSKAPPTATRTTSGVTVATAPQPTQVVTTAATLLTLPTDSQFSLYTHCGVNGAMINGNWWAATPSLSDGSGNPPPGWDNPMQSGTLHYLDATTAAFDAGNSRNIILKRTTSTDYPFICS